MPRLALKLINTRFEQTYKYNVFVWNMLELVQPREHFCGKQAIGGTYIGFACSI
jgi:hypothetical protein